MLKRLAAFVMSEESKELRAFANWLWNSHNWEELTPGRYKCKWCGMRHDSSMAINADYPICKKNPAIIKFKETTKG